MLRIVKNVGTKNDLMESVIRPNVTEIELRMKRLTKNSNPSNPQSSGRSRRVRTHDDRHFSHARCYFLYPFLLHSCIELDHQREEVVRA